MFHYKNVPTKMFQQKCSIKNVPTKMFQQKLPTKIFQQGFSKDFSRIFQQGFTTRQQGFLTIISNKDFSTRIFNPC